MKTGAPKKIALYARVSTGHQDVSMQVTELEQVAKQRGWTVKGTYKDLIEAHRASMEVIHLVFEGNLSRSSRNSFNK